MGRGYNEAMSALLDACGLDIKETTRRNLLRIMKHLPEVEQWRARQDNPDDHNDPNRVWEGFQKSSRQQDQRDAGRKPSPVEQALMARVAELEAALAAANETVRRLSRRDVDLEALSAANYFRQPA